MWITENCDVCILRKKKQWNGLRRAVTTISHVLFSHLLNAFIFSAIDCFCPFHFNRWFFEGTELLGEKTQGFSGDRRDNWGRCRYFRNFPLIYFHTHVHTFIHGGLHIDVFRVWVWSSWTGGGGKTPLLLSLLKKYLNFHGLTSCGEKGKKETREKFGADAWPKQL